jgi:hypothetical protein
MELEYIQFLVSLQKDQTALIYTLWNIYQGLAMLLIGYVFSQEFVRNNPIILTCFSTSIALFSIGNHSAIMRAQHLVVAATNQLNKMSPNDETLSTVLYAFEAPSTESLAFAHIALAVFLTLGIWVPYFSSLLLKKPKTT